MKQTDSFYAGFNSLYQQQAANNHARTTGLEDLHTAIGGFTALSSVCAVVFSPPPPSPPPPPHSLSLSLSLSVSSSRHVVRYKINPHTCSCISVDHVAWSVISTQSGALTDGGSTEALTNALESKLDRPTNLDTRTSAMSSGQIRRHMWTPPAIGSKVQSLESMDWANNDLLWPYLGARISTGLEWSLQPVRRVQKSRLNVANDVLRALTFCTQVQARRKSASKRRLSCSSFEVEKLPWSQTFSIAANLALFSNLLAFFSIFFYVDKFIPGFHSVDSRRLMLSDSSTNVLWQNPACTSEWLESWHVNGRCIRLVRYVCLVKCPVQKVRKHLMETRTRKLMHVTLVTRPCWTMIIHLTPLMTVKILDNFRNEHCIVQSPRTMKVKKHLKRKQIHCNNDGNGECNAMCKSACACFIELQSLHRRSLSPHMLLCLFLSVLPFLLIQKKN